MSSSSRAVVVCFAFSIDKSANAPAALVALLDSEIPPNKALFSCVWLFYTKALIGHWLFDIWAQTAVLGHTRSDDRPYWC
jgi:hypothetical protein